MPNPSAEQVITQGMIRLFMQTGEAAPDKEMFYGGINGNWMYIDTFTVPSPNGDTNPINMADPGNPKSYVQVGQENTAPDFPSFDAIFMPRQGGIPRELYDLVNCDATFYQSATACSDPSDLMLGPTSWIRTASRSTNTTGTQGGGGAATDTAVENTLSFKARDIYLQGGIFFGEKAETDVDREVDDVVYGSKVNCGDCGPQRNGTELIYAVLGTSGATVAPEVVYSVNGTVATSTITGAAATDEPVAIDVVGQHLIVVFKDATTGGYFLSEIDRITGVPGAWAKVTTGFVASSAPNDVYVANPREVYFCGDAGYVYKATSITQGVSVLDAGDTTANNLNRIAGNSSTVVAVGASDTIIFSLNRGASFSAAANATGGGNALTAVEVMSDLLWWVGDASGNLYYTLYQARQAWVSVSLPVTGGTVAVIQDVAFVTPEVGYVLATTSAPKGLLFVTPNGGELWAETGSTWRVEGYPTIDRANRMAYPLVRNSGVAANNLVIGGLADDGSDGILAVGSPNVV